MFQKVKIFPLALFLATSAFAESPNWIDYPTPQPEKVELQGEGANEFRGWLHSPELIGVTWATNAYLISTGLDYTFMAQLGDEIETPLYVDLALKLKGFDPTGEDPTFSYLKGTLGLGIPVYDQDHFLIGAVILVGKLATQVGNTVSAGNVSMKDSGDTVLGGKIFFIEKTETGTSHSVLKVSTLQKLGSAGGTLIEAAANHDFANHLLMPGDYLEARSELTAFMSSIHSFTAGILGVRYVTGNVDEQTPLRFGFGAVLTFTDGTRGVGAEFNIIWGI